MHLRHRHLYGAGFTILESLIAVIVLAVALGGLAVLASRQWSVGNDGAVLNQLENAVAADLGWLKTYAKYWRMTRGPYGITCTQAGFGATCTPFSITTAISEYQPDVSRCTTASGLAQDFVNAAAAVTITPARPYSIPTVPSDGTSSTSVSTDLGIAGLPTNTSLNRRILISNSASGKSIIYLSYSYTGTGSAASTAAAYRFMREVALRPEASAWCP